MAHEDIRLVPKSGVLQELHKQELGYTSFPEKTFELEHSDNGPGWPYDSELELANALNTMESEDIALNYPIRFDPELHSEPNI